MDVVITGRHVDITPELHRYVQEKAERLDRFCERLHGVHVVVSKAGDRFQVEMTVGVTRGATLVAHVDGDEVVSCVNQVESKIESQLRKRKERLHDHHRTKGLGETIADIGVIESAPTLEH